MQTGQNRPSLFFVHGAAATTDTVAAFKKNFLDGNRLRSQFGDVVFSQWREETPLHIGPAERAFPRSSKRSRELFSRLPGFLRDRTLGKLGHQFIQDVITYTAQRQAILTAVRRHLSEMRADTIVAVGHSLGGVILIDLLNDPREARDSRIKAVVTLGSPASYLYALNALPGLRFNDQARPFGPWINVWDAADPLASVASTVFAAAREPGQPILDVEVTSSTVVAQAHTSYWRHGVTWVSIALAAHAASGQDVIPDGLITEIELRDHVCARRAESALSLEQLASEIDEKRPNFTETAEQANRLAFNMQASVDIIEITEGKVSLRRIEASGAEYFRTETACYARPAIPAPLDESIVKHLVARYVSLRPASWKVGDDPWLILPATTSVVATDEARTRLAQEGLTVIRTASVEHPVWAIGDKGSRQRLLSGSHRLFGDRGRE